MGFAAPPSHGVKQQQRGSFEVASYLPVVLAKLGDYCCIPAHCVRRQVIATEENLLTDLSLTRSQEERKELRNQEQMVKERHSREDRSLITRAQIIGGHEDHQGTAEEA
jgi:hypothetical protein